MVSLFSFSRGALIALLGVLTAITLAAAEPSARSVVQALVERQARCWETGDEAEFLATLADDAVFAYPGKRLARSDALLMFRAWKRDFRDTQLRIHQLVIDGDKFSVEYLFLTTNRATGKRTTSGTVAVGEVRNGKLAVWKEYLDGRVIRLQASGELPTDEHAEPFPWPDTPASRVP